jgi:hypothetical protein
MDPKVSSGSREKMGHLYGPKIMRGRKFEEISLFYICKENDV